MIGWQPIETAPRDASLLFLRRHEEPPVVGWWDAANDPTWVWAFLDGPYGRRYPRYQLNGWKPDESGPTHWHPLEMPK